MAAVYDIYVDQGSYEFTQSVVRTDDGYIVDLTGFTIKGQFRKYPGGGAGLAIVEY